MKKITWGLNPVFCDHYTHLVQFLNKNEEWEFEKSIQNILKYFLSTALCVMKHIARKLFTEESGKSLVLFFSQKKLVLIIPWDSCKLLSLCSEPVRDPQACKNCA